MFYYFDDGVKFTSKVETLSYSQKTGLKPKFYYYDHVYEKLDWTIEPPETLDYYYKEQAQRIRDNYDYVILAYSGGYDSTNILETFHFNNIKLDKIITVGALSQDSESGVDENHNGELYHNVFPYVKELGLESIFEVIDYTTYFSNINNFSITKHNENWVDKIGAWFSPHNWFWNDIERYVVPTEWKGKKVALLFGKDKPSLFYDESASHQYKLPNHSFQLNGFAFRDTPVLSYAATAKDEDVDRINFYWDPSYTDILLKQVHSINRVYQITMSTGYSHEVGVQNFSLIDTNSIVYSLRKKLLYKSLKSKTNILSLRDNYLMNNKNSDVYELYTKGINKISQSVGLNEMIPIRSKFYEII